MISLKDKLENKKHIIWDWNGTLLNDVDVCVKVLNGILSDMDLKGICVDTHRKYFRFPVIDYYRDLGLQVCQDEFMKLSVEYHNRYHEEIKHAQLFEGTEELLAELRDSGKEQHILSAAEQGNLMRAVNDFEIAHHFTEIFGMDNIRAESKVERGHVLMDKSAVRPEQTVLIGDTDHDLAVGNALGIDVILVTEGHQCGEHLRSQHGNVHRRLKK